LVARQALDVLPDMPEDRRLRSPGGGAGRTAPASVASGIALAVLARLASGNFMISAFSVNGR
jgi:hypothetical protein